MLADDRQSQCVFGNGLDELILGTLYNASFSYTRWYHADDLGNTMAATDDTSAVVERYEYDDYGTPQIMDPSGAPRPKSAAFVWHLFNGRRYDDETGLYYYRTRYYDPAAGRFTTRDSIGIWGDPFNQGNGYAYVGSNPWSFTDPLGLSGEECEHAKKRLQHAIDEFIEYDKRMAYFRAEAAKARAKMNAVEK